jgi:hypothetical protein
MKPVQPVIRHSPFVRLGQSFEWAVYTARAGLYGNGHDVWEMAVENIP